VIVEEARKYRDNFKINLYQAARICGISYKSLWRYHQRLEAGEAPIQVVGRKPLPPIDYSHVKLELHKLDHGRKRCSGTGQIREKYDGIISRKKLDKLITEVRMEIITGRQSHMTRIKWDCPHMVWSMDDFEYIYKEIKFYVHQVQDLTSKYKFEPLVSTQPITGEEIAGNLAKLFKQYGAPLFMKRDNGSNLNHFSVINILQESRVIPLNSPAYYPQYNGSMERAQRETKRELDNLIWEFENPDTFPFAVRQAVHNVNHKPRPTLNGEWSCFQWQMHSDVKFSKTFRTKVYQEVKQLALDIAGNVQYNDKELVLSKSWRKAVQTWLHQNEHITIKRNGEVLPISDQRTSQN
jgi:hypothetical protein